MFFLIFNFSLRKGHLRKSLWFSQDTVSPICVMEKNPQIIRKSCNLEVSVFRFTLCLRSPNSYPLPAVPNCPVIGNQVVSKTLIVRRGCLLTMTVRYLPPCQAAIRSIRTFISRLMVNAFVSTGTLLFFNKLSICRSAYRNRTFIRSHINIQKKLKISKSVKLFYPFLCYSFTNIHIFCLFLKSALFILKAIWFCKIIFVLL